MYLEFQDYCVCFVDKNISYGAIQKIYYADLSWPTF